MLISSRKLGAFPSFLSSTLPFRNKLASFLSFPAENRLEVFVSILSNKLGTFLSFLSSVLSVAVENRLGTFLSSALSFPVENKLGVLVSI